MKFKIDFEIPKRTLPDIWPSFFMMGSCFAANQSKRIKDSGFEVYTNPFGIIYNPISIASLLFRISEQKDYTTADFIGNSPFFSLEHHGSFNYQNKDEAVANSNKILNQSRIQISNADTIVLTYGTSLVYHYIEQKKIVANCHKISNNQFEKLQLNYTITTQSISNCIKDIRKLNSKAHIIFTISPVRHLRSGVLENSRSKAMLITALHQALSEAENTSYFPSFEIFSDELRDYRFVKEDLAHPTEMAEKYIWNRFIDCYFSEKTAEIINEVQKLNQFQSHRPKTSSSLHESHVKEKRDQLLKKYPFIHLQ